MRNYVMRFMPVSRYFFYKKFYVYYKVIYLIFLFKIMDVLVHNSLIIVESTLFKLSKN